MPGYMHDIECHTICYLRDLLVTSAHRDPEITTFLTFWSFEEYWHGEAIATVLRAHGEPPGRRGSGSCAALDASPRRPNHSRTAWPRSSSARR